MAARGPPPLLPSDFLPQQSTLDDDAPLQTTSTPTAHPTSVELPASASIEHVTAAQLPSFRRLISLLLPVRYPDDFYKRLIVNPDGLWISRAALWQPNTHSSNKLAISAGEEMSSVVVGGICARIEPRFVGDGDPKKEAVPAGGNDLYISTLAVLSPYRGMGLASALIEEVVSEAMKNRLVMSVYAHVWEANDEALEWYRRRGFGLEERVIQGYYRRLKPGGARLVRRPIGVGDVVKGWPAV